MPLLFDIWARTDHAAARDALAAQAKDRILTEPSASAMVRAIALTGGTPWTTLLDDPRFAGFTFAYYGNRGPMLDSDSTEARHQLGSFAVAVERGRPQFASVVCNSDYEPLLRKLSMDAAYEEYSALPEAARIKLARELGASLGKDPGKGAAIIEHLPAAQKALAARGLAEAWASKEPGEAWDWLNARQDYRRTDTAMSWAAGADLEEAARILQSTTPSRVTDAAAGTLASRWAWQDPSAAVKWMQSLSDPAARRAAWRGAAQTLAQKAPEAAIAALTAADSPALTSSLYESVTRTLARDSLERARDFVSRLPPERAPLAAAGLPSPEEPAR